MPTPRKLIVDPNCRGYYHCISRCVRRAFLCGGEFDHRRDWIYEQLRLLDQIFAIDVAAFAVMSNHLHVIAVTEPERAAKWTEEEVARRWLRLHPGRRADMGEQPTREMIDELVRQPARIKMLRNRLCNLSWFMKSLKEPIARRANAEDGVTGAFWEGRFKSPRVLDRSSLCDSMVYVDLNPIRAGVATTPEHSRQTSIRDRIHARQRYQKAKGRRRTAPRRAVDLLDGQSRRMRHAEDGVWLRSIRDLLGCGIDQYIQLVDAVGRMIRRGAYGRIPAALAPILERLRLDGALFRRLIDGVERWAGTVVGEEPSRIQEAARRGMRRVVDARGIG